MNASSSRRRRRAVPSYRVVAALFFAATATAVKVAGAVDQLSAAVASALPDPSPSLRSAGDTLYTTLKSNATTIPFAGMGSPNGTSAIKSEQWMNMCSRARERREERERKRFSQQKRTLLQQKQRQQKRSPRPPTRSPTPSRRPRTRWATPPSRPL